MKFKKDYINFLLNKTIYGLSSDFRNDLLLKKIADKIISVEDLGKITYLVGKTAGLEPLFKYLLYISDKIDKSQVSVFNLKDNIDYDVGNLTKICNTIIEYKQGKEAELKEPEIEEKQKDFIKIDLTEDTAAVKTGKELESTEAVETEEEESVPEIAGDSGLPLGMTLIENPESKAEGEEVFELEGISETIESSGTDTETEKSEEPVSEDAIETDYEYPGEGKTVQVPVKQADEEFSVEETEPQIHEEAAPGDVKEEIITDDKSDEEAEEIPIEITKAKETEETSEEEIYEKETKPTDEISETIAESKEELVPEIEIEVKKHYQSEIYPGIEPSKEEAVSNEAYYKFETKFFEEVKILEKLLATVDKDFKNYKVLKEGKQLNEKLIQSLTEIIEITSELSNLSRQLMFDLIADVFLTMNLYYTKVISNPSIFDNENNRLFDSSLALVNSLIKGEDYLNYDTVIEKIEKLKKILLRAEEEPIEEAVKKPEAEQQAAPQEEPAIQPLPEKPSAEAETSLPDNAEADSALYKLKYLVKEFEKSFAEIRSFKGEYGRFEALEKINELNNALRLIAKISSSVKNNDVLKLAEVTYVFLKYLKDYRIDLMDAEIQQIVKYIIFTFKMLLTSRKPDDFNILVQHLNNPVKIFTDT